MPTEILGMVLQDFATSLDTVHDEFQPHWDCQVLDCSALIPISQTCRRLREVVQTFPAVLKSVSATEESGHEALQANSKAENKDLPLNVYISYYRNTPHEIREWYTAEAHRVQELHLTQLTNHSSDFWTPLLTIPAPKLRFLSLTSPPGVAWLPPKGVFLPLSLQTSSLRYLTLRNVCFLPESGFPSLTHLALHNLHVPRGDANLMKVLARCHKLQSLVLCNFRESIASISLPTTKLDLPHLRRITLYDQVTNGLAFYLSSLPRNPGQALQMIDFREEPLVHKTLVANYSPKPHTICISHHPDSRHAPDNFRARNSTVSLTTIGRDGVFHAVVSIRRAHIVYPRQMLRSVLTDKDALSDVREGWVVGIQPSKPISDSDVSDTFNFYYLVSDSAVERHRLAVTVRTELAALPSLEVLVHVFVATLEPNLYLLPNVQDPTFVSHKLKTLRLVICHGLEPSSRRDASASSASSASGPAAKRPELSLGKVCECLATEKYAYLDTLILQLAVTVAVDDAEILKISKYIPTVKVERIDALPEPALPAFCKEPAGRSPWPGALW